MTLHFSRRVAAAVVLGLGLVALESGCVAVAAGAAGAGAVAYVRGELESNVARNFVTVYGAVQASITEMELARISEHKTAIDARFVTRTALDKKIEIKLEKLADRLTKVEIRVGLLGDEQLSQSILERINSRLR